MRLNSFIIKLILGLLMLSSAVLADEATSSSSLSDLNFDSNENIFLRNLPWSYKDPFSHPDFETKKQEALGGNSGDKKKVTKDGERPTLNLTAILYSNKSSSAVINGRIVTVGSTLNRQKIIKIEKDKVKVDFNGTVYSVRLKDLRNNDE